MSSDSILSNVHHARELSRRKDAGDNSLLLNAKGLSPRTQAPRDSSTCSGDSWQRGNGQRVVAFAFYGNPKLVHHNTTYFEGILANVAAISSLYNNSNWSIRLYHDIRPDNPWFGKLCQIACSYDQLDLCHVNQLPLPILTNASNIFPMLWTLLLRCIMVKSPQITCLSQPSSYSLSFGFANWHSETIIFWNRNCKQYLFGDWLNDQSDHNQFGSFLNQQYQIYFGWPLNRSAAIFPHPRSPGGHFPVTRPRLCHHFTWGGSSGRVAEEWEDVARDARPPSSLSTHAWRALGCATDGEQEQMEIYMDWHHGRPP